MSVVCAWCGKVIQASEGRGDIAGDGSPVLQPLSPPPVSHGICVECAIEFEDAA